MARVAVAIAVVIALAAGVWWLWPDAGAGPTTTLPVAASTTTEPPTTTTTAPPTTTTTDHLVDTVEEAEEVLRDLWFRWFLGVYEQDVETIRGVVFLESQLEEAQQSFERAEYLRRPDPSDISFSDTEILLSSPSCLAVWSTLHLTGFREGSSQAVHIVRWADDHWVIHTLWRYRNDLWLNDCN
jgi:hypothetical protein